MQNISSFKVAPAGNKAYSMMLCRLIEANAHMLNKADAEADALSDKILIDVLAETILVGWDAAEIGIPYSVEAARLMLADKATMREVCILSHEA